MGFRFTLGLVVVLALAFLVGIIAARSQSRIVAAPAPTAVPTPVPEPEPHHVNIVPHPGENPVAFYNPARYTAHVGDKITWVDTDARDHTVTADSGAFDSGVLAPRQTFSWTPKQPGTYPYGCFLHPDVRGVIVVQP